MAADCNSLANSCRSYPPFLIDIQKQQRDIQQEYETHGGSFGARLPRMNDGTLLFLHHGWSRGEDVNPKEPKDGPVALIAARGDRPACMDGPESKST